MLAVLTTITLAALQPPVSLSPFPSASRKSSENWRAKLFNLARWAPHSS